MVDGGVDHDAGPGAFRWPMRSLFFDFWVVTRMAYTNDIPPSQLVMPMLQGVVYNLAWCGWQYWNRNAQMSGNSIGAQVRRWWWGVNNWPIPSRPVAREKKDWFRR